MSKRILAGGPTLTVVLALSFITLALLLLATLGTFAYWHGQRALRAATVAGLETVAAAKEEQLQAWFRAQQTEMTRFSLDPGLRAALFRYRTGDGTAEVQLLAEMSVYAGAHDYEALMLLEPQSGRVLLSTEPGLSGRLLGDRPFFQAGSEGVVVETPVYSPEAGEPVAYAAAPVFDSQGERQAVLAARLDVARLQAILWQGQETRQTLSSYLINDEGRLVTLPEEEMDPVLLQQPLAGEAVDRCLKGENGSVPAQDYRGEETFSVYRRLPAQPLCLLVTIGRAEALRDVTRFRDLLLGFAGIVSLAVVLGSASLAHSLSRPAREMQQVAQRFGRGEWDARMELPRIREFRALAATFNDMAGQMAEHISRLEARVRERTASLEAEIGEREQAETRVRRSEERLRTLFQSLPVPLLLSTLEGDEILEANEHAEHVFGYAREELPAMKASALYYYPEERHERLRRLQEQGFSSADEVPVRHADGRLLWLLVSTTLVEYEGQQALLSIFQDVSRRKRMEEELRGREELWRTVFDNSPLGMAVVDLNYRIEMVNSRLCEILGYREAELSGIPLWQLTHPADEKRDRAMAQEVLDGKRERYAMEKRYLRRDGEALWTRGTGTLVRDEDGQPLYGIAMIEDIDRRKQMEQQLRRNELLLRRVLEYLPVGVWIVDGDGQIVQSNPAGEQIWRGAKFVGPESYGEYEGWWLETGEPIAPEEWAMARAVQQGETSLNEQVRIQCFDGSQKIILNSAIPLRESGQITGAILVNQDITDLKQTQKQIERYAAELARSNEELEQFAYAASHDLQEPLRMVTSFLQLLQERYQGQLDEEADQFIYYAVDGATRMKQLIKDLLAYSRVTTRGREIVPVDSEEVLQDVLFNLQLRIEETAAEISAGPLPAVRADAVQLGQLFQNLIGNALKFHGESPPRVQVSAEPDEDGFWRFAVRDNGIGIEPRHAERIFVLFQRLHTVGRYEGTGIGLALCKKIVERHGGRIWVESTAGEGTTFYFTLPATGDIGDEVSETG